MTDYSKWTDKDFFLNTQEDYMTEEYELSQRHKDQLDEELYVLEQEQKRLALKSESGEDVDQEIDEVENQIKQLQRRLEY